jgi:hypothetical protein
MRGSLVVRALRLARWAAPLLAALALSACPYSSEQPLSDPASAVIDQALLGSWKWQDPESHEWVTLSFFAFNDHEMVAVTPGNTPGTSDAYRVFVTTIDTEDFLNVQELGGKETGAWNVAHYRIDGDHLDMRLLDDELFGKTTYDTPQDFQAFVRRNLADPRLYGSSEDTMSWQRAGSP